MKRVIIKRVIIKSLCYLSVVSLLFFYGCSSSDNIKVIDSDNEHIYSQYEISETKVLLNVIDYNSFITTYESPDSSELILITSPECTYCISFLPKLIRESEKNNISAIKFLDIPSLSQTEKEKIKELTGVEFIPALIIKNNSNISIEVGDKNEQELNGLLVSWKNGGEK